MVRSSLMNSFLSFSHSAASSSLLELGATNALSASSFSHVSFSRILLSRKPDCLKLCRQRIQSRLPEEKLLNPLPLNLEKRAFLFGTARGRALDEVIHRHRASR